MRVHQPGGHLMRAGRAQVDDWSWQQTKRRLKALYWLARPYKVRTALAVLSLLGATGVALAPPYLVGRAVDEVRQHDTHLLGWFVVAFVAAGALGIVFTYAQTYFTGWTGERMLADGGVRMERMAATTIRGRILEAMERLPPDATYEDAIERLIFLAKIEAGLVQLDAGNGIPHDEIQRRLGV